MKLLTLYLIKWLIVLKLSERIYNPAHYILVISCVLMNVWLTTSKMDHELLSKNLGFRILGKKEILVESQNVFRTQSGTKSTLQKWKSGNNNKKLRKMQKSKAFGLVQFFIFLNFLSNLLFRIVSRNKFWLLEKSFQVWQLSGSTICIFAFGQNLTLESF